MTLRLTADERTLLVRLLEARLGALHLEITRTDTPGYSVQLRREQQRIERLVARLRAAETAWPAGASARRAAPRRGTSRPRR